MRALFAAFFGLIVSGCGFGYPEFTPLIQEEILNNRDKLAAELADRDPPARLVFGMMVAKVRCDAFWQDLEKNRTKGDIVAANLSYISQTITPVLQSSGGINEKAVANAIWAIGLLSEIVKNQNEFAFLAVDKYRLALREKWDEKQRVYYDANTAFAEQIDNQSSWTRKTADEVNFRIYEYARLCSRPELLMTFDQIVTDSRMVPEGSQNGGGSGYKSGYRNTGSTDLPGFRVAR